MVKRIVGWVVLVPLSVALILFALANRQLTVVNFNPLVSPSALTTPGVGMPLFLVIFGVLLVGVVGGGVATWLTQGAVRRDKRQWQREAQRLGRELDAARKAGGLPRRNPAQLDVDDLMDTH